MAQQQLAASYSKNKLYGNQFTFLLGDSVSAISVKKDSEIKVFISLCGIVIQVDILKIVFNSESFNFGLLLLLTRQDKCFVLAHQ